MATNIGGEDADWGRMRERKTHQLRYEREGTQVSDAARMGGANKKYSPATRVR
jgi:hypothetical protein